MDYYERLCFEYNYLDEWNNCTDSIIDKLLYIDKSLKKGLLVNDNTVLTELKCFDKESGAGYVAVLAALYLVSKYANNPILGIKTAAYTAGIDTDTIACITVGLFGMLCGTGWIPAEWRMVQDYNCLCNIAEILLSDDMKATSKRISDSNINNKDNNKNVLCDNNKSISSNEICFNLSKVNLILEESAFSRITFKKVIQIVNLLYDGALNCNKIAKKLKVDENLVKKIQEAIN